MKIFYKDNGDIDYMTLCFDDGTKFNVYEPSDCWNTYIDLTPGSTQIVKLHKRFFDEYWTILKVINVPEGD